MDASMTGSWQQDSSQEADQHHPKKRKVRKGTQSCWECKRRKTRCTFSTPAEAICDGCRSRRTNCVSQEYDYEVEPIRRRADRLDLVETLVQELVDQTHGVQSQSTGAQEKKSTQAANVSVYVPPSNTALEGPEPDREEQLSDDLVEISQALMKAWPTQREFNAILSVPVNVSVLFHGVICLPYKQFFATQVVPPCRMLQSPVSGTHPVLVARKLLMLATWLQGVSPSLGHNIGFDYLETKARAIKIASRLVTSNDDLIHSIEGIECIMIESMYHNNAGNLRRAWWTNRRAMYVAQLLGLHKGGASINSFLEAATQQRIDPNYMWFRIAVSDRYLSLMLGLPQGSPEASTPHLGSLEDYPPVERLERIICIATGLTLQRNSFEQTDFNATSSIDKMLQDAAALMSPQWWLPAPNMIAFTVDDIASFEETVRLTTQIAHRHLLVQLHLPYMLKPSSRSHNYDYSKLIVTNSSRTILTQFVSFRHSDLAVPYCRGFDFVAFVASVTLCLAHIEARHQHNTGSAFRSIIHQRLSDRGLIERALEILENVAHNGGDVVAKKICSIIPPLLVIEDASEAGMCYRACTTVDSIGFQPCKEKGSKDALHIEIPYYGTVKIEECSESELNAPRNESLSQPDSRSAAQGNVGYEFSRTPPANYDWHDVPSFIDPGILQHPRSRSSGDSGTHLLVPGLSCEVDDWALQGVDMTLFHNLLQQPNVDEPQPD